MPLTDVRVDDQGIHARSAREVILDVAFDGRRIWSFWLHRDGVPEHHGHTVAWPDSLRAYLNGVTELQDTGLRAWTDDYSDILGAFISRWQGRG